MSLSDRIGEDEDPERDMIVVLFNATPEEHTLAIDELTGELFTLHRVQLESNDSAVREARYGSRTGSFTVPALTTAVFELPQSAETEVAIIEEPEMEGTAVPLVDPTSAPAPEETETVETVESATKNSSPWVAVSGGIVAIGIGAALALVRRRRKQ